MSVNEFVLQLDTLLAASKEADSWTPDRLRKFTEMFNQVESMWTGMRQQVTLKGAVLDRADRQIALIRAELNSTAAKRKSHATK